MNPLILLLLLTCCASGSRIMTQDCFYEIPVGTTKEKILSQAGSPASIKRKGDGIEEFEYIEKLKIGARTVLETHYIFTLKDGKVANKRIETSSPPPTTFDSYEMQTTEK